MAVAWYHSLERTLELSRLRMTMTPVMPVPERVEVYCHCSGQGFVHRREGFVQLSEELWVA